MGKNLYQKICLYYASESGNAQQLANSLQLKLQQANYACSLMPLNELQLPTQADKHLHLIICSTYDQGEAPENGRKFASYMQQTTAVAGAAFDFAVFGLGDIVYSDFCQFAIDVDSFLAQRGGRRVINLVTADLNYRQIFNSWLTTLQALLAGDASAGLKLNISAKAYSSEKLFHAPVEHIRALGTAHERVYELSLDLSNSGIYCQPGDLVYIVPNNPTDLVQAIVAWFDLSGEQAQLAQQRLFGLELKKLPKQSLRQLAKLINNNDFNELLLTKNKDQLQEYLHWHDLLDILQDWAVAEQLDFEQLCACLPKIIARAYSVVSINGNSLKLLIKQVVFNHKQRQRIGKVSAQLNFDSGVATLAIYVRSNANFHLDSKSQAPVVMLAIGTGIAPFIGFLEQVEKERAADSNYAKPMYLFFGEKYRGSHFFYQTELEQFLNTGVLNQLFLAFSRDQAQKIYIQDLLRQQGEMLWQLLEQGAVIYVCGSNAKLAKSVEAAYVQIMQQFGNLDEAAAKNYWRELNQQQRLHFDLY